MQVVKSLLHVDSTTVATCVQTVVPICINVVFVVGNIPQSSAPFFDRVAIRELPVIVEKKKVVFTPVKVNVLRELLGDYPDRELFNFVLSGFEVGFKLGYKGGGLISANRNNKSAYA